MVEFRLLQARPLYMRYDLLIFLILYSFSVYPSISLMKSAWIQEEPAEPSNSTFSFLFDHLNARILEPHTFEVLLPIIVMFLHIFLYLLSYWSIKFKVRIFFISADEKNATHVAFFPKNHHGGSDIVKFVHSSPPYATFQQKKREFINGKFVNLTYPSSMKIKEYLSSDGLTNQAAAAKAAYYGENSYDIPIPSFTDLFKQNMLAPFFVFQLFSISCMMLDDYFIYSVFSILSLFIIEANTVRTRQYNLTELRGVKATETQILTLRDGCWKLLASTKLVPGDLVLLDSEIQTPADLVLLSGRVVVNEAMLTGESTPQVKESISSLNQESTFDLSTNKRHVVFGGTRIEQVLPSESRVYIPKPGAVAYVISTGLGSSQGRLIRTILFASERVAAESKDSLKLLVFLTFFAIFAASYVVYFGVHSTNITSFRIILQVINIITSTIPPDLPMELTFSVNASLLALSKLGVYCTEPFRIPFAGTISTCCFDKTGTLTKEEYRLIGIDELKGSKEVTISGVSGALTTDVSDETLLVIGGCNSLVKGKSSLIGDSLEAEAFERLGFSISTSGNVKHKKFTLNIAKTFHFSSELRRMTTVCVIPSTKVVYALMKGAPEVVADFLSEVPQNYANTYRSYTRQGCRVLSLAIAKLPQSSHIYDMPREAIEKNLQFAGFAVFSADFKPGTEDTIVELLRSTHRVIVITGDDPLTACHVAKRLHIINKNVAIHDIEVTDSFGAPIVENSSYESCYTGKALQSLNEEELRNVVKSCNVYARMSPQSKALVVSKLADLGEYTLMAGDGTNDVGALKMANVGVGLVEEGLDIKMDDDEYKPKLGAASIAAPFVTKRPTISACTDIIRFGRATLSGTIDLFKLLALNSLISAYTMSVLFVENVKFGDIQMTVVGLILSVSFMGVTWATPLRELSKERPFQTQFNGYLIISVVFQFIVHFAVMLLVKKLVVLAGYSTPPFDYHVKFTPSLMNTAMFLVTSVMQVTTFVANYRGRPFMQGFFENKMIGVSVGICSAILLALLFETNPEINKMMELVPLPDSKFRNSLIVLCLGDAAAVFLIEKICLWIFTAKDKRKNRGLVSEETIKAIEGYNMKNDDILPEEDHKFGIIDMFKENFQLQKKMALQRVAIRQEMKQKGAQKGRKNWQ